MGVTFGFLSPPPQGNDTNDVEEKSAKSTFGPKREEVTEVRKCIMRSFIICIFYQILL
jgi:hypothetical protein